MIFLLVLNAQTKKYKHYLIKTENDVGDEAKEFDELSPEESKRRLGIIVDRVDLDKNKVISREELKKWIKDAEAMHWQKKLSEEWKKYKPKQKDALSWEE